MEGENKYYRIGDPFKLLIEEALMQQRNEMMDSFTQILRQLPTGDTSSLSGGDTSSLSGGDASSLSGGSVPFKVQINFDIPIFEG
jgi:hypothetical protein